MRAWPTVIGCICLLAASLGAQGPRAFDPGKDVAVAFQKGKVVLTVPPGAHLKAAFMEVALKPGTPGTLKVGPLPPTTGKDEVGDGIWHGRVAIPVAGDRLPATLELAVTYQPCTEGEGGVCYPPTDRLLKVKASDVPSLGKETAPRPPETPSSGAGPSREGQAPATAPASPAPPQSAAAQETARPPQGSRPAGLLWAFLAIFGAGLLASLTPCVYPMIPITMAIIGAKGGGRGRGLALSLTLVLGMAVTYTALGVLAATSGAAFGAFAQSPWFLVPVSVLFAAFAVSLLGAFEIRLPEGVQNRLQGGGPRKGFAGAFVMGLVLGPLSAPCVGPVVGSVLLSIAQEGQRALGAAKLFTFSLGMGVLFVLVGTFSAALPRSGDWLVRLKQGMGVVVLAFAIWNLRLLAPAWASLAGWSLVLFLTATLLGVFQGAEGLGRGLAKGLGILALALGVLLGVRAAEAGLSLELLATRSANPAPVQQASPAWLEKDLEGAMAQAKASGKVVVVDTYAQWCAQCKELDEKTWPDAQVSSWIRQNAVAVRIDTDRDRKDLAQRLRIAGYPTVLVLDGDGKELRRSMGFLEPGRMLAFLQGRG